MTIVIFILAISVISTFLVSMTIIQYLFKNETISILSGACISLVAAIGIMVYVMGQMEENCETSVKNYSICGPEK